VCKHLNAEDGLAICDIHSNKPKACKDWYCDQENRSLLDEYLLDIVSGILNPIVNPMPLMFVHKMWMGGAYKDISFTNFKENKLESFLHSSRLKRFIKTCFYTSYTYKPIKDIVRNPEWYNGWRAREAIEQLPSDKRKELIRLWDDGLENLEELIHLEEIDEVIEAR